MTGVSASGATSEYVRQELRAVVGARTGQSQSQGAPGRPPSQLMNQVSPDLDALGINFEMPSSGKDSVVYVFTSFGVFCKYNAAFCKRVSKAFFLYITHGVVFLSSNLIGFVHEAFA